MLYAPIIEDKLLPHWVPVWGGERFTFFSPIFNIADASISIGVILLLLFQKKFFRKHQNEKPEPELEADTPVNDTVRAL
jgi:signal peptidase II